MTNSAAFGFCSILLLLAACSDGGDSTTGAGTASGPGSARDQCIALAVDDTGYDPGEVEISAAGNDAYNVSVFAARFQCTIGPDGSVTGFVPV